MAVTQWKKVNMHQTLHGASKHQKKKKKLSTLKKNKNSLVDCGVIQTSYPDANMEC